VVTRSVDNRQGLTQIRTATSLGRATANFRPRAAADVKSRAVVLWHALLCTAAALNLVIWSLSALAVSHAQSANHLHSSAASLLQVLLAAGYVFGCAYRSVLPVYDIPRFVLVNSRLSSVMVGRSIATVAELCFAAQWALVLHRMALLSNNQTGIAVSLLIVPLILLAEGCSWYAVLTTAQRPHALENSIWGIGAALIIAGLLLIEPHRVAGLYLPMIAWCVGGAAYVAYIFLFDVPAYWSRWRADQASGRQYLSLAEGVIDAWRTRIVSYRWEIWKTEVLWMSLYFTLGAWSSISLVYASIALGAQSN
jgi:hypothetical protein